MKTLREKISEMIAERRAEIDAESRRLVAEVQERHKRNLREWLEHPDVKAKLAEARRSALLEAAEVANRHFSMTRGIEPKALCDGYGMACNDIEEGIRSLADGEEKKG